MPVSNSCDCPNPPGGRAVCEPYQVALCIIEGGVARQECHTPPGAVEPGPLINWSISTISGVYRDSSSQIELPELQMLLGNSFQRNSGETVTFALTSKILDEVQTLIIRLTAEAEERQQQKQRYQY
jgi:hypothetical protein